MSIFLWLQSVQWWRIQTNKLFFPNSLPNMLLLTCMDKIYIHSYKKNQPELSKVMRYWSLSIASLTIFTTRPNAGILTSGIERPQTPVRNAGWKSKALPCYSLVALMSSLAWNLSAVLPAKQLQPPKKVCTVLHFVLFCLVHFIFACHYLKIIEFVCCPSSQAASTTIFLYISSCAEWFTYFV